MTTYAQLLGQYKRQHGDLVTPKQGFGSLHRNLHLAYSEVIVRGYYDVGTYANKPGDHSWGDRNGKPGMALAFDTRREGWLGRFGWQYLNARRTAQWLWDNHEALHINYVIVGRKIISRENPVWHPYTRDTSHDWHLHCSGVA